jgi:hypothetical protein
LTEFNEVYTYGSRFQILPSVLLIGLKKNRGRYLPAEYT